MPTFPYIFSRKAHDNLVDDYALMKDGREILHDELSSPVFFNLAEIDARLPTFFRRELQFGPFLGLGESGVVREVKRISLFNELRCSYSTFNTSPTTNSIGSVQNDSQVRSEYDNDSDIENLSCHFSSRHGLAALCKRNGVTRYAVKNINVEDSSLEQQTRARTDLAIEVSYLKVLSHPHIVRIRGSLNTSDLLHPQFFFLMDKLNGTLCDKIGEWDQRIKTKMIDHMPIFFRCGKCFSRNRELLKERLSVAHDIASACSYMHHKKVIHRDIKKQNIGFDIHGNVKVFDFGLAKSLREDRLSYCNYYNLTANVGSIPYMAPEVALANPYNEKCDVFSFGILLYEIVSLRPPFSKAIMKKYLKCVAEEGKRPCIMEGWPSMTKVIMKSSWMSSPSTRPSMEKICMMIKMDLQELELENNTASGISYNINISKHISSRVSNLANFYGRN